MLEVKLFTIDDSSCGQRIDNFLFKNFKSLPRTLIYRKIRKGEVRVNKKRIKPEYKLIEGDVVRTALPKDNSEESVVVKPSSNLVKLIQSRIIHDSPEYLVINKPANYAVHGGSGVNLGIIEALRQIYDSNLELAHRLDKGTSGCLVIAKKIGFLRDFHKALRDKIVDKTYVAVVKNANLPNQMVVNTPLLKRVTSSGERIVRCDKQGQESSTKIKVIKKYKNFTLIEAKPVTGRTHQIRVHCQNLGANIAGDLKYGNDAFNQYIKSVGGNRMFLHARSIECMINGELFSFDSGLESSFESLLKLF